MDFVTQQHIARLVDGMKPCSFTMYFGSIRGSIKVKITITTNGELMMPRDAFLDCMNGGERPFRFHLPPNDDGASWDSKSISTLHDELFATLDEEEQNTVKQARAKSMWDELCLVLKQSLCEFFHDKYPRKLQMQLQKLENKKRKLDRLLESGVLERGDLYSNAKRFKSKE